MATQAGPQGLGIPNASLAGTSPCVVCHGQALRHGGELLVGQASQNLLGQVGG